MSACFCIGPQNGEKLCPCQKRQTDDAFGWTKAREDRTWENLLKQFKEKDDNAGPQYEDGPWAEGWNERNSRDGKGFTVVPTKE